MDPKAIDEWYAKSFHNTAVSQDTPVHNILHAAVEDLKARLAKAGVEAPAATIVAQWERDCIAGNSVLQRSECAEVIAAAVAELHKIVA